MTDKPQRVWLTVCSLCALPFTLGAQPVSESAPIALDPVEVQSERSEFFSPGSLPFIGAVSHLDKSELDRALPRTLEEVVLFTPGVQAQSRAGDDIFLSIRGSGLQSIVFTKARGTDLLIDGIPVNSADGNFDYSLVSPLDARSVDIYRGNISPYGSNTLGGALNLVSATGHDLNGGRVRIDGGSFGFLRGSIAYGKAGEKQDFATRYTYQRQDGFRDYSDGESHKLSFNMGNVLNDTTSNRLYLNVASVRQKVSLPITQQQVKSQPTRAGDLNPVTDPYFDVTTVRIADKVTFNQGDTVSELSAFYLYRDVDFRRPSMPPSNFRMGPGWLAATTHDIGAQMLVRHHGTLFERDNTLSGGLRIGRMGGTEKLYPNLATVRGPKFADGDLIAWNSALWLENDHALTETLSLVIGAKLAYAYREYKDNFRSGAASVSGNKDYVGFSPKIALNWDVSEKASLFVSLGRSYEPPAFGDMIGIPIVPPPPQRIAFRKLNAQKATTLEIGTRGEEGRFTWEASLYRSWVSNEILRFDDGTQTGNQVGRNADKTIHDGLEVSVNTRLWQPESNTADRQPEQLSLRIAYAWTHYSFDGDPTYGNNELAGIPHHTLAAELLYEHSNGFYAGINLSGSLDAYAADNANTYNVNDYLLLGARAGWRGERISIFIDAHNLTDESYVAALQNGSNMGGRDAAIFFPGAGRAIYTDIEWRW